MVFGCRVTRCKETLAPLILQTLAQGTHHGYGITCYIQDASGHQLRVEEGSMYPGSSPNGIVRPELTAAVRFFLEFA
jgi:hypothetical protein